MFADKAQLQQCAVATMLANNAQLQQKLWFSAPACFSAQHY